MRRENARSIEIYFNGFSQTVLKVTKHQGFAVCLEDTFFEKPQGGQIEPLPSSYRVKSTLSSLKKKR